jgi:hypothetical protein
VSTCHQTRHQLSSDSTSRSCDEHPHSHTSARCCPPVTLIRQRSSPCCDSFGKSLREPPLRAANTCAQPVGGPDGLTISLDAGGGARQHSSALGFRRRYYQCWAGADGCSGSSAIASAPGWRFSASARGRSAIRPGLGWVIPATVSSPASSSARPDVQAALACWVSSHERDVGRLTTEILTQSCSYLPGGFGNDLGALRPDTLGSGSASHPGLATLASTLTRTTGPFVAWRMSSFSTASQGDVTLTINVGGRRQGSRHDSGWRVASSRRRRPATTSAACAASPRRAPGQSSTWVQATSPGVPGHRGTRCTCK